MIDIAEVELKRNCKNIISIKLLIIILPIIIFIASLTIGRYPVSIKELITILSEGLLFKKHALSPAIYSVIFKVRLPRIMTAMVAGTALSLSGASYQGMFKNPLVSPDILGASAGAAFGAAIGILFSFGVIGIQLLSFGFGLLSVFLTYIISLRIGKNGNTNLVLILSGMLVSTLFTSFVTLIKYVADPYSKLPAITFWLMGSLASINTSDFYIVFIALIIGIIPLILLKWKLNVLSFGDDEARALGVNTGKLRLIVILCSTLMTASVVSVAGLIGWVGLIVPHFVRILVGPNFKDLIPASIFIGSAFLLLVDDFARCMSTIEIPLGILTSIIGAPFFIYLMINAKKGWL